MSDEYNITVGLEAHVKLDTDSKMFCGCKNGDGEAEPNSNVCPVCMGLPGSLPVINKKAVEYAVKIGKALNCDINHGTRFHRKNYYYPDLPKNFQISQYTNPICENGYLDIRVDGSEKRIGITRAHMEEDPGALTHKGGSIERSKYTLIDYNRSGTPLMEIVTEPDIGSPAEARAFIEKIRETLEYLGVFKAERSGALRVDANISVSPDESISDTRSEVKNIGSTKGVEKALSYEATRQKNKLRRGGEIVQETRHFDDERGVTVSLRSKEEEKDYRYFEEPDLPVLRIDRVVDEVTIPELRDEKRSRFMRDYGVGKEEADKLTSRKAIADFFEDIAGDVNVGTAATWVSDELLGELNYRDMGIDGVSADGFLELVKLVEGDEITDRNAVKAIRLSLDEGVSFVEAVEEKGLGKTDDSAVVSAVETAIEDNPDAVGDFLGGDEEAINYLVGQVMKETGGGADPGVANEELRKRLEELKTSQ